MGLERTGDWEKARRLLPGLAQEVAETIPKAVKQEAEFLRKSMIQRFKDGGPGWPEHSPMTIAVRALQGNMKNKLLIQTSDLRGSVRVIPIDSDGSVFVGVSRSAPSTYPGGIVNLAAIHEQGREFKVHMSDKSRRLLFAAIRRAGLDSDKSRRGAEGGAATVTIKIPARPFVGPVIERYCQPADLEASIAGRVAKLLKGKLGEAGRPREG